MARFTEAPSTDSVMNVWSPDHTEWTVRQRTLFLIVASLISWAAVIGVGYFISKLL